MFIVKKTTDKIFDRYLIIIILPMDKQKTKTSSFFIYVIKELD